MTLNFARHIALGDSISIDIYPAADVARRHPGKASTTHLGAASLLYKNDDRFWPEFRGRDLHTKLPTIAFDDLASDGATTETLARQVAHVRRSSEPTLITITAGGNDLLSLLGTGASARALKGISDRLRESARRLIKLRPNALVLVGTVYDPTDGTNRLPGYAQPLEREAEWLRQYNEFVRHLAASDRRLRLADIHAHFLGHGLRAPARERWYLEESIIEPNARGASEVRRLWLEAIGR